MEGDRRREEGEGGEKQNEGRGGTLVALNALEVT